MLRTLKIVLAMLLMSLGAAAYADPPGRVARLNQVSGVVSFAPAEAPDDWTQAVLNRPLTGGDRLWADSTGRAEVHMGSTAIRLNALTNVDILNLDDQTLQLRLAQGSINLRVRDLAPGETLEIATPSGAVLVRQPGSYRVSTDPQDGTARVLVNFGQAEVVTPGQNVAVPTGQVAVVSPQSGIAFEVAAYASGDEFDRWSADRDRREDRISSTRYVSRDMTGYEDLDQYGGWRTLPEYGAVWVPTRVTPGWAPYRYGHWAWISPWGWTWVDDAPWGFAPFHYGRWVHTGGYWAWAPGAIARRPVYAPALVAFVGGSHLSVSVSSGPAVGWFPLGYREPFIPWYRASPTHVRNVNVTNVTNVTNVYNTTNVTNIRYANRDNPQAVTVVPQQAFVSARPVAQASVSVAQADLARAQLTQAQPAAEPVRASVAPAGSRPPPQATAREVVAVTAPPTTAAQASFAARDGAAAAARRAEHEPRVRVIGRERFEARAAETSQPQPAQGAPAVQAPAAAGAAPKTPLTGAPAIVPAAPAQAAPRPVAPQRAQSAPAVHPPAAASAAPTTPLTSAPPVVPVAPTQAAPRPVSPQPAQSAPAVQPPAATIAAPKTPLTSAPAVVTVAPAQAVPRPPREERRAVRRETPAPSTSTATAAPRPEAARERPAPRAEHRQAPHADARPAVPQPEARPAPRPEERRSPRADEPPKARPAPTPGQGASRAAAPEHEVRFSERPAAAPKAAQPPQQRPAEAPRAPAPQPREARRTHPAQP